MEQTDLDDPLLKQVYTIGLVYNLKKGIATEVIDDEAEYDSIETIDAIKAALETKGHRVLLLEADNHLVNKLFNTPIDIAFNIAEGCKGRSREAQIPAILSYYGIPFTGSDETTLCLALDKALTKRLLSSYKIRTPKYAVLSPENPLPSIKLKYPVLIKPNAEGSSKGISDTSIVKSHKELMEKVEHCFQSYPGNILAEEYIDGREFTVGILGNGSQAKVFPPMEIIYKKATQEHFHVYSYNVKQNYQEYVEYQCPALLSKQQKAEIIDMSKRIFNILGCCDFARIDYRMSTEGKVYFLEINPLPGLAPDYSDYPMLAKKCGVSYTDLINGIVDVALKRLKSEKRGELVI